MRFIFAGGGTGGHLFPGIALAQALMAQNKDHEVLFVGSHRPIEAKIAQKYHLPFQMIDVRRLKGGTFLEKIVSNLRLPGALFEAYKRIATFRPDCIIGLGGFSAGPLILVGFLMRKKTVILEQNIIGGLTNRICSIFTDRIYVSFPKTKALFNSAKMKNMGNPIRQKLLDKAVVGKRSAKRFCVFIIGGSQGAHDINRLMLDTVLLAGDWKGELEIIHQTGSADKTAVTDFYLAQGFSASVFDFIDSMEDYYPQADVVISRAGASSLSELLLFGKCSILIPFPHAADNHQYFNARYLADQGAAILCQQQELTPAALKEILGALKQDKKKVREIERAAKALAKPKAAYDIATDIFRLLTSRTEATA